MKLKKLFQDLKRCKKYKKEHYTKWSIRFEIDTYHYYFAFLPTITHLPWIYRQSFMHDVVDIWWLNMHILIGHWGRKEDTK